MIIQKNFNKRAKDIEEVFMLMDFIGCMETHRNNSLTYETAAQPLNVSQEMQCILKAQFLLILYNLIESTVYDCLQSIYDAIEDDELTFSDLSDELKLIWIRYRKLNESLESAKQTQEIMDTKIKFDSMPINISGNIDLRKIFEIFPKHGCILDDSNRKAYSNSFLAVKNRRNALAHGNICFSECGSSYLISDLKKYKEDIINGMQEVINHVKAYTRARSYRVAQ